MLRFPLLVFVISGAAALVAAVIPSFVIHPRSQILLPRTRLSLNCSLHVGDEQEKENVISIKWLLNGSRIGRDASSPDQDLAEEHVDTFALVNIHYPMPNESVLIIERFNHSYDGVYQCLAVFHWRSDRQPSSASLLSEPASVSSASMPKMKKTPDLIVEALENQTALMACDIPEMNPRPLISFIMERPNTKIPLVSDKYYTSQQGSLQVAAVTHRDAGHYRCVYTNPVGGHERKSRQRIHLKVTKTPKNPTASKLRFLTPLSFPTIRVLAGSNLTLECAATAVPAPEISWERFGSSLPPHNLLIGNLQIQDFQKECTGTYQCKATSGEEFIDSTRIVELGEAPGFSDGLSDQNVIVYFGRPFSLSCGVFGNPVPVIQWFHNALVLPSETDSSVDVDDSNATHSGMYQCFATNQYGTSVRTFVLTAVPEPTTTTTTTTSTTTTTTTTTTSPTTASTTTTTTTPTTTTTTPSTTTSTTPTTTSTDSTTTTMSTTPLSTTEELNITQSAISMWDIFDSDDDEDLTTPTLVKVAETDVPEVVTTTSETVLTTVPTTTERQTTTVSLDEFTELPDWMPDSPPESIDYDFFVTALPDAETVTTTPAFEELTEATKKPKKGGKKYHTKPTQRSDYEDEEDEADEELMVPPSQPEVERASDDSVMLRWEVPPNDGLEISFFKIQYRNMDSGEKDWSTMSDMIPNDARAWQVPTLTVGGSYRFRISAVYSNHANKVSKKSRKFKLVNLQERNGKTGHHRAADLEPTKAFSEMELPVDSKPPTIINAQSASTSITVQWSPPENGPIKGYYIYFRETSSTKKFHRQRILDLSSNTCVITDLQPATQYQFKMQSFNEVPSDFSSIFEYATLPLSSDMFEAPQPTNLTGSDTAESRSASTAVTTTDEFFLAGGNNTQKSSELLYMVLGIVVGAMLLLLVVFMLMCKYRKRQLKKKNPDNPRFRNRLRSSSREFNKDRMATLHTPAYLHPAFVANGAPFAKSQSNAELDAMRPLSSSVNEPENDSEPETESVERSVPRSRKTSPMDNHSLYVDPNEDVYMPERTTDTFRRPSSAHPAMIAAWNDANSEYSTNTARSVDHMGRRKNQKLRSQIKPHAQLDYYE